MRSLLATACASLGLLALTGSAGAGAPGAFTPAPPPEGVSLRLLPVATGLEQPIFVTAPASDPRLYIIERVGRIRILEQGGVRAAPFLDLCSRIDFGGERGLLGLAFAPDYRASGRFYICYSDKETLHTVVARMHANAATGVADLGSMQEILRIPQTAGRIDHKAGWIGFRPGDPDDLYIAAGDGGDHNDPDDAAQNLRDRRGKLLRVDVTGDGPGFKVPKTNPYAFQQGALPEIWSRGLRNPYRCSFDRETGDLYIGDVGQDAREEIDFEPFGTPGGRNYGWRVYEGRYRNPALPPPPVLAAADGAAPVVAEPENFVAPLLDYAHQEMPFLRGCVIGGYVYRGAAIPALRGHYVFGDFTNARIYSIVTTPRGEPTALTDWTVQLNRLGESVAYSGLVSFGEDSAGELYVVDFAGTVLKMVQ